MQHLQLWFIGWLFDLVEDVGASKIRFSLFKPFGMGFSHQLTRLPVCFRRDKTGPLFWCCRHRPFLEYVRGEVERPHDGWVARLENPTGLLNANSESSGSGAAEDGARAIKKVPKRRVSNSTESFLAEVEAGWCSDQMSPTPISNEHSPGLQLESILLEKVVSPFLWKDDALYCRLNRFEYVWWFWRNWI